MKKILTVLDTFDLKGRGLVVVGDWNDQIPDFRLEDKVEIIRPDGSSKFSIIKEMDRRTNRENGKKILSLGFRKLLQKSDIPIGSEIFINES